MNADFFLYEQVQYLASRLVFGTGRVARVAFGIGLAASRQAFSLALGVGATQIATGQFTGKSWTLYQPNRASPSRRLCLTSFRRPERATI